VVGGGHIDPPTVPATKWCSGVPGMNEKSICHVHGGRFTVHGGPVTESNRSKRGVCWPLYDANTKPGPTQPATMVAVAVLEVSASVT
jgi:hypothetical protein